MPAKTETVLKLFLFSLGFTSLFTQIYAVREFMSVLYGNELILGFVLASWMVLTALGATAGNLFRRVRKKMNFLIFLQFFLSVLPILTLLKLDLWKAFAIPPGTMISPGETLLMTLIILAPFCLINGFFFVACSLSLAEIKGDCSYGRSYSIESIGSLTAGVIVNFLLLWVFDQWDGLIILLACNFLVLLFFFRSSSRKSFAVILMPAFIGIIIGLSLLDLQGFIDRILYPGQNPLISRMTPYGKVLITESNGQFNLYENGLLLFSTGNEISNEEAAHFLAVQHDDPEKILLISGGLSGLANEFLNYQPQQIDYLELNPALIASWRSLFQKRFDQRIRIIEMDAGRFLNSAPELYDLCLINLPDPSTLQINRFYTVEFFRLLKSRMNPGGYIALGLPPTMDYVSEEAGLLNSIIFHTLKKNFSEVRIIPGQKNYFIASDSAIHMGIAKCIMEKGIMTKYVNHYYLDDEWLKKRGDFIEGQLTKTEEINTDMRPLGFFLQISYWFSYFSNNTRVLVTAIIAIAILLGFLLNSVNTGLFISGFTASSVELMILLTIQVTYGYIFQVAGMVITLFMAGLAAGAWVQSGFPKGSLVKRYIHLQLTTSLFCLGLPFLLMLNSISSIPAGVNYFLLVLVTLFISVITGMLFTVASSLIRQNKASVLSGNYSAELIGSALGMVITTILLLPLFGLIVSCLVLVVLNLIGAGFLAVRRKKL